MAVPVIAMTVSMSVVVVVVMPMVVVPMIVMVVIVADVVMVCVDGRGRRAGMAVIVRCAHDKSPLSE
jgi:hypothetical protein